MAELPTGTVTFVFTDIEGSTRMLQALGDDYGAVLEDHRRVIRDVAGRFGGSLFGAEGDAAFLVFPLARGAVEASAEIQRELARGQGDRSVRVRIGVHTGEGFLREGDYVGLDVHRVARIAAAGHGGQTVMSEATATLVRDGLPPGTRLRDLAEHRLKDLNRPEHLYQLDVEGLQTVFPPLRTLDAAAGNLPIPLTRFVGRERELEEARSTLKDTALLTLSGPGGTGKTRLSIQLADSVRDEFSGGVWFVALASITDPSMIVPVIAETLGLLEAQGDRRTPFERVADHLRQRELLMVLDNLEQIPDVAPVIGELLRAAPRVKVVATSRAVLRVYGEREFPVPPLRLPDPRHLPDLGSLSQYEAVALFIDRARAVKPDFDVTNENAPAVAEICARLDGLPLAIELAAARIRLLSPEQMLARMGDRLALLAGGARDLPARQQTLRNAIMWSHDLLSPGERRLFARVSVFMGGCLLEEAESVCGPGQELGMEVFDGLTSLVEKSLLTVHDAGQGGTRFGMLETIREFGLERLEASDEAQEIRRRHAVAYLELADRAEPELTTSKRKLWLDRLEPEHDNVRAALEWAIGANQAPTALGLVAALWRFWQMRGHLREGRDWAGRALALPDVDRHPRERIRALLAAGGLAYWSLDRGAILELYEEALRSAEDLEDTALLAEALYNAAWTHMSEIVDSFGQGAADPDVVAEALGRLERSLKLFDEVGDRGGMARVHWGLGDFAYIEGRWDPEGATRHLEKARAMAREVDDVFTEGWSLYMLANAAREQGKAEEADQLFKDALRIFHDAHDVTGVVFGLEGLAGSAKLLGRPERAVRLAAAAAGLRATSGTGLYDYTREELAESGLPEEEIARAHSEGLAMTLDQAVAYALEADRLPQSHRARRSRT